MGNYLEIGPFEVVYNEDGEATPKRRKFHWNDDYHLLFMDSPVGVGFSVADPNHMPTSSIDVAEDVLSFI